MSARAILRQLLARYLDEDPLAVSFTSAPSGKLALASNAGAAQPPAPSFNVSHSADVALFAVARDLDVGIDVQVPRPILAGGSLAARIAGEAEAERLRELPPAQRGRELLRSWVRLEAQLKCTGAGIGARADSGTGAPAPIWVSELEVAAPALAALAATREPQLVRGFSWPAEAPGSGPGARGS
jgi:4'-phosphopantetheinyl transferase